MGVTIRYKKSLSQKESVIYFDIYNPPMPRERRFPGLKIFNNPNNELDKSHNKEIIHTVKSLRNQIEQEILSGMYSWGKKKKNRVDLISYFIKYIDSYKLNDKRNIIGVKNRLIEFIDNKLIYLDQVDENFVYNFAEFLNSKSKGEGALSYYRRFKKVIKSAIREGYLTKNPCEFVNNIKKDERILKKEILTIDEVNILIENECKNEHVKLAFLFCIHSGLRWCDVKTLTWNHIKNDNLIKPQQKTGKNVNLPITDEMRAFIPKMTKDLVFILPSHNGAVKCLKQWVRSSGIEKNITWHCARHTAGTLMSQNGANEFTIATGLGHSNTRHTNRYVRVDNNDLKNAMSFNKLKNVKKY
jgi:integrase